MYPNQPTPPPAPQAPLPSDYLNQIAPQAPKKSIFQFGIKQVIIVGVALIVLVSALALVVGASSSAKREPLQRLYARIAATETIANDAQTHLKSSKLRSVNSNLKLYMTNTIRDIEAPLETANVSAAKIDKNITASESTAELASRLEDARLNAVYDATYAREMTYQLGTLLTLMNEIYGSTSNAELKAFLKTSYDNLKPTQESFASYSRASDS